MKGGGKARFDELITPGYKLHRRPDKRCVLFFLKLDLTVKTYCIAAYRWDEVITPAL